MMPICIECSYPVSHLYSTYSRADDRSLGKGVRLTQCPRCQRFADKYVEYDFVVIFIDLVLIKPQVYRHLLFNRLGGDNNQFDRSIIRLGVLLLLFDVYLTWARIEKSPSLATTFLSRAPIIVQYFFFLGLNALATLAHHLTIRALASVLAPAPRGLKQNGNNPTTTTTESPLSTPSTPVHTSPPSQITNTQSQLSPTSASMLSPPRLSRQGSYDTPSAGGGFSTANSTGNDNYAVLLASQGSFPPPPLRRASTAPIQSIQPLPPPSPASPTAISTALLVSSCAKLFPILLVIWGPDGSGIASQTPTDRSVGTSRVTPGNVSPHALNGIAPAATTTTGSSGIAGSPSPASSTLLESLIQMLPQSVPTSYLANFVELTGSLFSLGAADTHLVLLSNIEALYVLLGCGYLRAVTLAVAGLMARWTVQRVILGAIGVS
ncbi:Arv1-like family-domain-containing protein [Aspergillus pseudocaelatus]|uniref:Protein ARV n=1 Tax=Aspergillus pseudocaelatus TaxID=1825620 RepID=A0ABQ6WJT7_9EURO|nr:Arv1-like family-domain-containing protein [Aspergillus pseudocaelatus]